MNPHSACFRSMNGWLKPHRRNILRVPKECQHSKKWPNVSKANVTAITSRLGKKQKTVSSSRHKGQHPPLAIQPLMQWSWKASGLGKVELWWVMVDLMEGSETQLQQDVMTKHDNLGWIGEIQFLDFRDPGFLDRIADVARVSHKVGVVVSSLAGQNATWCYHHFYILTRHELAK